MRALGPQMAAVELFELLLALSLSGLV